MTSWASKSRAQTRTTCLVQETWWCARGTQPWATPKKFNAQSQVLDTPNDVRCGRAAYRISSLRMHHQRVNQTCPDDNVDLNFKGLDMNNMPRPGDQRFDQACPGDNVAADIKRLDKKSGRPSLRTTRRWWPAGAPAPRSSRRTWPAGAPAPCTMVAHAQTFHETRTSVDTQTTSMTPAIMTSIAIQTTDLSHETSTSVKTQTMPRISSPMTSFATQTTDLSHETSISVETQTMPMASTPMTPIATQTTDLSHETNISMETQTRQRNGKGKGKEQGRAQQSACGPRRR